MYIVHQFPYKHLLIWPGATEDQIKQKFLGGGPQLRSPDLIYSGADRYHLKTVARGNVILHLNVITRNFEKYGIEMWCIQQISNFLFITTSFIMIVFDKAILFLSLYTPNYIIC